MESKTLSKIHALVALDQLEAVSGNAAYSCSFVLRMQQQVEREQFFFYIFSNTLIQPFSISLDFNGIVDRIPGNNWLDQLVLMLSHPLYFLINGKPMIGFLNCGQQATNLTGMVEAALVRHNFVPPIWIDMNKSGPAPGNTISYTTYQPVADQKHFNNWYLGALTKTDGLLHLFTPFDQCEMQRLLAFRQAADAFLKENNSIQYGLIEKLQAKSEQLHEYQQLVGMLTEDLQSKKDYLEFLLGKFKEGGMVSHVDYNEIMKIKQFYYREYEVLPLWYKRFGHIIKVLTGKRTLKSIFSDDVPKYK